MRDIPLSNSESWFLLQAMKHQKRLDGRNLDNFRNIELHFGSDYGCTYVTLGETKVVAQVTCEIGEPRNVRQNEGNLLLNIGISDNVCANFETGHQSHLGVHANRLLEQCIKESRCVDLEALCIISGEQVWEISVDVTVLNYDGNLHTCCSVAALAALSHFKTPHVTMENSEIKVHSMREHEPQPLSIHHFPILISFAVFSFEGETYSVLDPNELEEKVSEAELVFGMNSFRELCGLHFRGNGIVSPYIITSSANTAALIAADIVKTIKDSLEEDKKLRLEGKAQYPGLTSAIHVDRILSACQDRSSFKAKLFENVEDFDVEVRSSSDQNADSDESEENFDDVEVDRRGGTILKGLSTNEDENTKDKTKWVPSKSSSQWLLPNADIDEESSSADSGSEKDEKMEMEDSKNKHRGYDESTSDDNEENDISESLPPKQKKKDKKMEIDDDSEEGHVQETDDSEEEEKVHILKAEDM